jgi:hypothetical protein
LEAKDGLIRYSLEKGTSLEALAQENNMFMKITSGKSNKDAWKASLLTIRSVISSIWCVVTYSAI